MGGAVVRNKYVWIFVASPPGPIVGAHLYSACKTGHVAPRPRRFRCETIGNVRYRIPRGRITRTLRANVKRTRRRERGIRHEPEWNFLASLCPFSPTLFSIALSLSLSLTFRSSGSDASAWRMVIVLDRSKWFRSLERTRTYRTCPRELLRVETRFTRAIYIEDERCYVPSIKLDSLSRRYVYWTWSLLNKYRILIGWSYMW